MTTVGRRVFVLKPIPKEDEPGVIMALSYEGRLLGWGVKNFETVGIVEAEDGTVSLWPADRLRFPRPGQ